MHAMLAVLFHTCMDVNVNMKTVAEVKQIASQLGQPSTINTVEVHNSFDVEVSTDCTVELYNINNIKSSKILLWNYA